MPEEVSADFGVAGRQAAVVPSGVLASQGLAVHVEPRRWRRQESSD